MTYIPPLTHLRELLCAKSVATDKVIDEIADRFLTWTNPAVPPPQNWRNWKQVRDEWYSREMCRAARCHRSGDPQGTLAHTKRAAQISMHTAEAFLLHTKAYRELYRDLIFRFEQFYADVDLLVLHLSCVKSLPRAQASCETFKKKNVGNLIIFGGAERIVFSQQGTVGTLGINCPDSYEHLTDKIGETLSFLGSTRLAVPVIKVDDDISCKSTDRMVTLLGELRGVDYAGFANNPASVPQIWHFGKCATDEVNYTPSGFPIFCPWADGRSYLLSAGAIDILSKLVLVFDRFFKSQRSNEDIAVGSLLFLCGIGVHDVDFVDAGIFEYTDAA